MIKGYKIGKRLARGNDTCCYEAENKGEKYCLKIIKINKKEQDDHLHRIKNEVEILDKMKYHPNIISFKEYFKFEMERQDYICIVTDLIPASLNLHQYLKQTGKKMKEIGVRKIAYQLLEAMSFMHNNLITHQDIKLQNIVVDPMTMKIKLIDFGFSTISNSEQEMCSIREVQGSPYFVSPEKFGFKKYDGRKSDIWSCGILIYRLVSGKFPFGQFCRSVIELSKSVMNDELILPNCSDLLQDLLINMLQKKPKKRIEAFMAMHHKWFDYYAFHSYLAKKKKMKENEMEMEEDDLFLKKAQLKSKSLTTMR